MAKANQTRVNRGANDQYKVTVPKALAESNDLDGKLLEWQTDSGNAFRVVIKDEE